MAKPSEYDKEQDRADRQRDRATVERNREQEIRDRRQDFESDVRAFVQYYRDDRQEDRLDGAESRLRELSGIQLQPVEAASNPAAHEASPAQRLRISIPNVRTDVTMGAKAAGAAVREGFPNRAGFGVATDGDIFMTTKERACVESEKDVLVQAQESAWFGGKAVSVVASPNNTIVSGGSGLVLTGGATIGWEPNFGPGTDALPAQPSWSGGWGDPAGKLSGLSSWFDTAVGAALAARAVVQSKVGVRGIKAVSVATWAGIAGAGVSAAGAVNGLLGSHATGWLGGTTIHGTAGLVANTFGTMGLYAGVGATIAAGGGVAVVSPIGVGLTGGLDVDIAAGKTANLVSGGELTLMSKKDAVLDSNTGMLTLGGKDVALATHDNQGTVSVSGGVIGITGAIGAYVSSGASAVLLDQERGSLTSNGSVHIEGITKVSVSSKGEVQIGSPNKVAIRSGEFFSYVKPDMAVLGMAPGTDLPDPPVPPELEEPPAQPPQGNRALRRWCDAVTKVQSRNAKKLRAHAKAEEDWLNTIDNLQVAQVGVLVKKSGVDIVCDGNKLTLDKGKLKTLALVVNK
ncbi:MAG: hypothetical protein AB7S26_24930 [Sandaracinaceae bacterium]